MIFDRLMNRVRDNKSLTDRANLITNRLAIEQILRQAMRDRRLLQVSVGDNPDTYSSAIIAINPDSGRLALDEFTPIEGHHAFLLHKKARITGQSEGIEVDFEVNLHDYADLNGVYYYKVGIPTKLIYAQRRSAYRVRLMESPAFVAHNKLRDQHLFSGYATDLSPNGVGLIVQDLLNIQPGEEWTTCSLKLPEHPNLLFGLKVAFAVPIKQRQTTRLGGEFTQLKRSERERIERIVRALEREFAKQHQHALPELDL